jgi:hypothetical protein
MKKPIIFHFVLVIVMMKTTNHEAVMMTMISVKKSIVSSKISEMDFMLT